MKLKFEGRLKQCSMKKQMSREKSMKLLIDKRTRTVLFAEAGNDFVDFLFSLLAMPIGSVVKLLTKQSMVGCVAEIYESFQNLNDMYMRSSVDKTVLLEPETFSSSKHKLTLDGSNCQTSKYYTCHSFCNICHITAVEGTICPSCGNGMEREATMVVPASAIAGSSREDGEGGYVKDAVTFMITDDLVVTPMSTISCFTLMNKFSIKDISTLEEKVVEVGLEEGLKLLRASLESRTALTDVFSKEKLSYSIG